MAVAPVTTGADAPDVQADDATATTVVTTVDLPALALPTKPLPVQAKRRAKAVLVVEAPTATEGGDAQPEEEVDPSLLALVPAPAPLPEADLVVVPPVVELESMPAVVLEVTPSAGEVLELASAGDAAADAGTAAPSDPQPVDAEERTLTAEPPVNQPALDGRSFGW